MACKWGGFDYFSSLSHKAKIVSNLVIKAEFMMDKEEEYIDRQMSKNK